MTPIWPSAATRVVGVIGDPVRHSLSPILHNAAFRALDLDWVYVGFEVADGDGPAAVAAARALGLDGLSVTMPHKSAVIDELDALSPTAERLGAVNTILRKGSQLVGENTDGAGFLDALRYDEGFDPAGRRCVIVGAGGAARAIVLALASAGATVTVVARNRDRGEEAAALAGTAGSTAGPEALADAELIVNATPVGMSRIDGAPPELPVDVALLQPGQLVVDLVYHPPVTALITAAHDRGVAAVNGVGMLIHQAAHQFRLWTGQDPPLAAMSAAAVAALARAE